jgi:3-oxoacyl-[acyl-carrier protein] reductase
LKTIIITGASKGIGYHTAKILSKQNKVIAISRSQSKNKELTKNGVLCFNADISKLAKKDFSSFLKQHNISIIDAVINNAGLLVNKPFQKLTYADYKDVFDVNFFGAFNLIQLAYPFLIKSKTPHVVNISSIGGVNNTSKFPGLSIYSSSKGALTILTECLAEEFKNKISVNALALGAVNTEMLQQAFPNYKAPINANQMANYIADFTLNGHKYFNGQIIKVALSNP